MKSLKTFRTSFVLSIVRVPPFFMKFPEIVLTYGPVFQVPLSRVRLPPIVNPESSGVTVLPEDIVRSFRFPDEQSILTVVAPDVDMFTTPPFAVYVPEPQSIATLPVSDVIWVTPLVSAYVPPSVVR